MQLGILNACSPTDEVEFGSREFVTFQEFFCLTSHTATLVEYRITEGEFPASPAACDAFLITGSPKGVYDDEPWIAQLGNFIRDCHAARAKMVGICFGHQILAQALGGHAAKSEKGWGLGWHQVEIQQEQPWMNPPLPTGGFYFCHQDQVVDLPAQAELLAGNEFCPNGMFVIGEHVLGLQAHPEFTPVVMRKAIEWLRPQLDAGWVEGVEAATIGREIDSVVMAQWIVNFLAAGEE